MSRENTVLRVACVAFCSLVSASCAISKLSNFDFSQAEQISFGHSIDGMLEEVVVESQLTGGVAALHNLKAASRAVPEEWTAQNTESYGDLHNGLLTAGFAFFQSEPDFYETWRLALWDAITRSRTFSGEAKKKWVLYVTVNDVRTPKLEFRTSKAKVVATYRLLEISTGQELFKQSIETMELSEQSIYGKPYAKVSALNVAVRENIKDFLNQLSENLQTRSL